MSFVQELKRHAVTLIDATTGEVECDDCGYGWWDNNPGWMTKRKPRYWLCPTGCNDPDLKD